MNELPIEKIREAFFSSKDRIKVVRADTGSGKTTRIPLWYMERGIPFVLIEPRRVVVRSIYEYLKGFSPQGSLGYQVRFEKKIPPGCLGLIVTPGIYLNYLSSSSPVNPKVIMIDEFHERHKEVDFLLSLLREKEEVDLVLLSATLDAERLDPYLDFELFEGFQGSYQVEVSYENKEIIPNSRNLPERILTGLQAYPWNVALVFLPGKREIFETQSYLAINGYQNVFPVFGGQSFGEHERALRGHQSRILLTTNLLESAVTVEGVDLVIDSGLCRALRYRQGQEVLGLEAIAQDAAIQRKGRTGRTSAGVCYRLWHQKACLEERTLPEILRSELSDLLLRGKQIGVSSAKLHYLDPPESYQWEEAEKKLTYLGLLSSQSALAREFTVSPDLLAIICVCKERVPDCLNYLLFFIALVESSVSKSPLATLKTEEKGTALDWELWRMAEGELADKIGVEFESWKKTYQSLRDSFGSGSQQITFSPGQRRELFQVLMEFFPRSLFYPTRNNLWRNDFSRECLMPDSVDSQHFDAVFVLNLFEIQDQRRRRNVIAEVFFCLEKKGGFLFPPTRTQSQALRIQNDRAYLRYKHYFGSLFLKEEEKFLHGEEFLEVFSDSSLLEPLFPSIEKNLYYLCLFTQEKKQTFHSKEYLLSRLRQAGVTCYEDLLLLLLEDFFTEEFFQEYSRLQKVYPGELEEPGGKYSMRYDLNKKEVTFIQERGRKEPSKLLKSRFSSWKCFWLNKGRCVRVFL